MMIATLGVRGLGWNEMAVVKGSLDESLIRRLETLSEKNGAKNSARDGFGIIDGSKVVYLRCSKEIMLFQGFAGWELMTE